MISILREYLSLFIIRIFALVLISTGFISTLYLTISNHRTEESHYSTLFRMAPWSAWQLEREFYNFRETFYLYTHSTPGVDRSALLLRYEILLSRLAILQEGGVIELIGDMPGILEKIEEFEQTLLDFEPRLITHEQGDVETLIDIDRAVRAHGPFLREFSDRSVLGPEIGRVRQNIVDAYTRTRTSTWALSVFSILLVLLLIVEIIIGKRHATEAETSSRRNSELADELGKFKARVELFNIKTGLAFCITKTSEYGVEIKHVSGNFKDVLGCDIKSMSSPDLFFQLVHPSDRARVRENCMQAEQDGRPAIEFRVQQAEGKVRWISHTSIVTEFESGQTENMEVFQDVTEQRMATEVMQQSSRLLTLGELAAGLAHEINQPLSVIRLSAYNASNRLKQTPDKVDAGYLQQKLTRIFEQVERTERLTEQMKVFSRPDSGVISGSFLVSDALDSVVGMISKELQINGIALASKMTADDIEVLGGIEMLEQALMNIILNARDAICEARGRGDMNPGRIDVVVEKISRTRLAQISISDDGGGIAPDIMDTMFAPFVTTKPPGKGTGLGLWISSALITRLGGTVTAQNSRTGAVFTIQIPVLTQMPARAAPASETEA